MAALTFNSCCFVELRIGCFIIGYTYLILDILFSTVLASSVAGLVTTVLETEERQKEVEAVALLVVTSIALVWALLMLAFIITLLVGLHKQKPGAVLAFLVGGALFILLDLVTFCVACAYSLPVWTVLYRVAALVLEIFFFMVIRSYYYKMKQTKGTIVNSA